MRKYSTIALSLLLTGLFTLTFAWGNSNNAEAENISPESNNLVTFDKESDFKNAHTRTGCNSIPYYSERNKCSSLAKKQKVACDKTSCKGFDQQMKKAIKDENKNEMDRLVKEGGSRQIKGTECKGLRKEIMVLYKRVESKVKREKTSFENSLKRNNSSAKIEYYKRMIQYADKMLDTYEASKEKHRDEITEAGKTYAICKKFNDKY